MKLFTNFLLLVSTAALLTACSVPTDELSEEINKKVEEEVGRVVDRATEEGKKKVDEVLLEGKGKVGSFLGELLGSENAQDEEATPLPPANTTKTGGSTEQIPVKLISVSDGDTIRIIYNNSENGAKKNADGSFYLRYLLTDAPESVHPTLGQQPFGREASKRNKELLEGGKVITVEFDIGERVDRFGRLLGYIEVDGVDVSEVLIREGLARLAYVYPPNTRHLDRYEKDQEQAKKEGVGIWSIENYAEQGFKQ